MTDKEITTGTEEIKSPIIEPILNHLKMKTSGALLLTGEWGCGKTYHIKNYVFPVIEKGDEYIPIIVSLYGETDKNNIAQKVLFAYFDSKGKNVNIGTGTIANNLKRFSEAVPFVKNYVDIEKLIIGTGENVLKLIPHDKLLICFDDVERMSDEINVDDFLGIINDLVENKGCKVLLIANETEIKNGITYKEKTIEKTIHFTPNLNEIFDSVIATYSPNFKSYLQTKKDMFIQTLTANSDDEIINNELKKSFSNIRTLKFALEHFRIAFEILVENNDITDLLDIQLKNIWNFTLSISIEFRKPNNLTLSDKKKLDKQTSTIIDFGSFNAFSQKDKKEEAIENEWTYSDNFKKKYFNRLPEPYFYYEELYNLITAGKQIDNEQLRQNVEDNFNIKEGKVNPAHKILNSFLRQGYWNYTDEGFKQVLIELLEYCEQGTLEDIVSYLNSGVYLLGFKDIIEIEEKNVVAKIKTGLDLLFSRLNLNYYVKSQFEVVKSNFTGDYLILLVEHIKQRIKELEELNDTEEVAKIQLLFGTDLPAFAKEFQPEREGGMRTPNEPLLHRLEKEVVKKGIENSTPNGIMCLSSMLNFRYLETSYCEYLTEEMSFLIILEEGIAEKDSTTKTLTNHVITQELLPKIADAKYELQKCIDKKNGS